MIREHLSAFFDRLQSVGLAPPIVSIFLLWRRGGRRQAVMYLALFVGLAISAGIIYNELNAEAYREIVSSPCFSSDYLKKPAF